jgi:fused signal recognition particle receptor
MAFNWFRRQHSDSSNTASQETQKQTPQTQPSAEPVQTTSTSTPEATQDLLAYAKAAYKNIQQKQQQQQETVTQADQTVAEAPPETPELAQPPEQTAQAPQSPKKAEESDSTNEVSSVTPVVAITEEASTEDLANTQSEPTVEETEPPVQEEITEPTAPATLSLLQKAAAERQAKQERLIATAIELPQPETLKPETATTTTTEVEEIPDLVFDEGFLWSTEVLAAQGRRPEDISIEEITWLKKLRQGLDRTRRNIVNQLKAIVGQGPLNQAAVSEIEGLLLQADVGIEATDYIITTLQNKLRQEVLPPDAAIAYLKEIIRDMLDAPLKNFHKATFAPEKETFNIWLITGVNGAGKTTTIGKIAHLAKKSGYKCLIGAADTFRAAAVEQVKIWGERSGVEVIANPAKNSDPAAVVFDAISAAMARSTELLLVDTAGRLQNKKNLMEELSKIRRIINKKAPNAKVESLLVLDATLGQNGLRQAEVFSEAAQLSGVVLTKLDGTAKGGVALAVVQQLGLPIRFIGAGEGIEDLRPFSSYEFVEALLNG